MLEMDLVKVRERDDRGRRVLDDFNRERGWVLGVAGGVKGCVFMCEIESKRHFEGKDGCVCVISGRGRRWVGGRERDIHYHRWRRGC